MSKRERTGIVKSKRGRYKGQWLLQPSIDHPPFCVRKWCKKHRRVDEWAQVKVQIINRVSPHPDNRSASLLAAARTKQDEETKLRRAVEEAAQRQAALPTATTVKQICDAYRVHHEKEGKRLDRDKYRIDQIEQFFGEDRDAASVSKMDVAAFRAFLIKERKCSDATVDRYLNTLVAIFNSAVNDDEPLLASNPIARLRRNKTKKQTTPTTFSPRQVDVLLGAAIDELERRRAEKKLSGIGTTRLPVSEMPLRGFCLIAYRTLMRPQNNFTLRWEDVRIDLKARRGSFRLEKHKNSRRGLDVEAPLAPSLLNYLISIMPSPRPTGLIHPNPKTGKPYTNIRDQWYELIDIANSLLPEEEKIVNRDFYRWRASGASALAASGADAVLVTRLMGDSNLETVLRHYFSSHLRHMEAALARWDDASVEAVETSDCTTNPEKVA